MENSDNVRCGIWILIFVIICCPLSATAGPLHEAAEKGDIDKLKELIAEGADINEKKDSSGNTPLEFAAYYGHADVVQFLVGNGANLSVNAMLFAARQGHKDIVELFIAKGIDVNSEDNNGITPLHIATLRDHRDVAELLIGKGADVNKKDKWGKTPLYRAVEGSHTSLAELLIVSGANLNLKNEKGSTLLHIAAFNKSRELVELLISKGADVNEKNVNGKGPLHTAAEFGFTDIAELLKKHGAALTPIKERETKRLPFSVASDSWSLKVTGLSMLPGKEFDYYELMGMNGSISQLIATPDLSKGVIPKASIIGVGDGETIGWWNREGTLSENFALAALSISITNESDDQLSLEFGDIKLENEDGYFAGEPLAFKIRKQPIYKSVGCQVHFPPAEDFDFEFLFIIPEKLHHAVARFPTLDEQYIEITK